MAMTTDIIVNAMNNIKSQNMTSEQAASVLAQAVIDTVKQADFLYGAPTLISGAPGDPVTGTLANTKAI